MNRTWMPFAILTVLAVWALTVSEAPPILAGGPVNVGDTAWLLTATGLVLLMTPGLSYFYAGMVSTKNVISTMLQSFISLGVIALLWAVVGFSLSFGESYHGLIGDPRSYFMLKGVGPATHPDLSPTIPFILFAMFQLKFAVITPALITGSFAERVRFSAYLVFICLFSVFIYCTARALDVASTGIPAAVGRPRFRRRHGGAYVRGIRGARGRDRPGTAAKSRSGTRRTPPANIPYVLLGTGMLWFGWFGFNAGSALSANATAAMAFATTHFASAAAMLTWILLDVARGRRPSALGACIGSVVGLVAITPAAGYVSIPHSIFIGFVASVISNMAVHWKSQTTLDDTLDVFPCHGVGGIVGMLLTGVLAGTSDSSGGQTTTFLNHLWALAIVSAFRFFGSLALFRLTDWLLPIRVTAEQEAIGLDLSQHGEFMELEPMRQFGYSDTVR